VSIADPIVREEMNQGWLKNARRVTVPAGGLLLWSSRLTHQGWSGGPRLGQLVCWEPKERRTETARARKVALSALGLPSTHWASLGKPRGGSSTGAPPKPVEGMDFRGDSAAIIFPMKSTIRSYALKPGVDQMKVWHKLEGLDLDNPLPESTLQFLDASIKDELKKLF
jgi:hypothetical protein